MVSLSQLDVVTHRGSYLHLENSLSAIEDAISMGFKWIEFDVRLTKDNVPVVMHDATLGRTTNGKGFIRNKTYQEIAQFRLKTGDRIPTLEDVIKLCKGRIHMWMHIKMFCGPVEKKVWEAISTHSIEDEVVVSSLSAYHIAYIRSHSEKTWTNLVSFLPYFKIGTARNVRANSVQPRHRLTAAFVRRAQKHKLKVLTWPIHSRRDLHQYIRKGVDLVMTGETELLNTLRDIRKGDFRFLDEVFKPSLIRRFLYGSAFVGGLAFSWYYFL